LGELDRPLDGSRRRGGLGLDLASHLLVVQEHVGKPYHDFTSHAADEWRGAAVIEDHMTNEEDRPLEDDGREEHDDVYD
jgi:hypothetical protein